MPVPFDPPLNEEDPLVPASSLEKSLPLSLVDDLGVSGDPLLLDHPLEDLGELPLLLDHSLEELEELEELPLSDRMLDPLEEPSLGDFGELPFDEDRLGE